MSKFLLNLLVQISKALINLKVQFLIQKFFFFAFGPANLTAHSAFGAARPAGPSSPCIGGVFTKVCFPFLFASSELVASLSSLYQVGPGCQLHLPPPPADHCRFFSSPPATPRRPASNLEMPSEVFTPRLDSPPPHSPSSSCPAINGVKTITTSRFPLPRPGVPLPDHYKRARSTPSHHHTHPALNCSLLSPQRPPHQAHPPPIVPHRRLVVSDPPPPPLTAGEAQRRPLSLFPQPR
jgi:hypothetical protein